MCPFRFILSILILLFATSIVAKEQSKNRQHTIDLGIASNWGLRFSNGLEVSHQRYLADNKQLELNAGISTNQQDCDLILNGNYEWTFPLTDIKELEWYTGPSLHCGIFDLQRESYINLGFGGLIGITYLGSAPFQFTLDLRPVFFLWRKQPIVFSAGLGVRYFIN